MGYECPVCDAEEADGEHLANHLAFTALVRGGDHEAFLDEHVPDWESRDPESLASDVTPHATETDTEPVTEPRGHQNHDHDHEMTAVERTGQADLSGEAAAILDDAVELTEAMRESRVADPNNDADGADVDGDADGADVDGDADGADVDGDADGADAGDAADPGSDDPGDELDGERDGADSENE
ncbi:DUF5810 domain-containing protein [Halobacterium bonnevillei]|uniref:Uncharacterized protein n=1 Tax=Halobacterium bonnevillei TaxID=2692200 RepID=A0A6B0SE35_9EURY|nr:DUF5810 domain-containing protein [Halobacterium bonnevillei]MXR19187.1 hypothetical protein [Halobacterium bonnevillei]